LGHPFLKFRLGFFNGTAMAESESESESEPELMGWHTFALFSYLDFTNTYSSSTTGTTKTTATARASAYNSSSTGRRASASDLYS